MFQDTETMDTDHELRQGLLLTKKKWNQQSFGSLMGLERQKLETCQFLVKRMVKELNLNLCYCSSQDVCQMLKLYPAVEEGAKQNVSEKQIATSGSLTDLGGKELILGSAWRGSPGEHPTSTCLLLIKMISPCQRKEN